MSRNRCCCPSVGPVEGSETRLDQELGGSEAGSYLRLIDSCVTQRKAQGPSHESKEENLLDQELGGLGGVLLSIRRQYRGTSPIRKRPPPLGPQA